MMKFTLGFFAILAIIGPCLGQTHQFPDFGTSTLHEDFQDILDLVPLKEIIGTVKDYLEHDNEVREFFERLDETSVIKDLLIHFETTPEVIKLLDYLRKEGVNMHDMVNTINKAFNIEKYVLSEEYSPEERTGGLHGFFMDITQHLDYDALISTYVDKLKTSTVFVNFIKQLKSDNFQQLVNKVCKVKPFHFLVNYLKENSVNVKMVGDVLYLVFDIDVLYPSKTLMEEFTDFFTLIPMDKFFNIVNKYVHEDEKVRKAVLFMLETEFHDMLRALEATKEHQALVVYIEKAGFPIIEHIQKIHKAIGMEKYESPLIANFLKSLIEVSHMTQKIGDGMQGMLKDLYDILPLDKIDALYEKKMRTSKVFADFMTKITSKEMKKISNALVAHKTYKEFITRTNEKGLDCEGTAKLSARMIGLKF